MHIFFFPPTKAHQNFYEWQTWFEFINSCVMFSLVSWVMRFEWILHPIRDRSLQRKRKWNMFLDRKALRSIFICTYVQRMNENLIWPTTTNDARIHFLCITKSTCVYGSNEWYLTGINVNCHTTTNSKKAKRTYTKIF